MPLESTDFEHRTMTQVPPPSLIETMLADACGHIALLPYHLRRLKQSAQELGYTYPGDDVVCSTLRQALNTTDTETFSAASAPASVSAFAVKSTAKRVRLLLDAVGQLSIQTAPLPALEGKPFIALTSLRLSSHEPYLQHKTTHRPWYDATTQWLAQHSEYFDLIFLNEKGELCEGSRSNIYLLKNKVWLTPPLSSGLLGGVQRTQLLETGQVKEAILTPSDLVAGKTPIKLSNALRGWFDVQLSPSILPGHFLP